MVFSPENNQPNQIASSNWNEALSINCTINDPSPRREYLKRRLYLELLFVNSYLNFRQNRRQPTEPNGLSFDTFGIGTAQVLYHDAKSIEDNKTNQQAKLGRLVVL